MQKVITLRCAACGETHEFRVGAGPQLATWREIAERLPEKEAEKVNGLLTKLSEKRSKAGMKEACRNAAEVLCNVHYDGCGEEVKPLLGEIAPEDSERIYSEKVCEGAASSDEKWADALQREGVLAFEAVYLCPKTRRPKQGVHVSLRIKDEKGTQLAYVYKNGCDDCGSALTLADDGNIGFMHIGCETVANCPKCGKPLTVDGVNFKLPQAEQTEGGAQ